MSECARCGAALHCAQADGPTASGAPCWCLQLPAVLPVPAPADGALAAACWCPACLKLALAERTAPGPSRPPAGVS